VKISLIKILATVALSGCLASNSISQLDYSDKTKLIDSVSTREIKKGSYSKVGTIDRYIDTVVYSLICKYNGEEIQKYTIGILDASRKELFIFNALGNLEKILKGEEEIREFDSGLPECPILT